MKERVQLYLASDMADRLRAGARVRRITVSSAARKAVIAWLASNDTTGPERPQEPRNDERAPRARRLHVRVSDAVLARLQAVADDHGQTAAGWTAALLAHILLEQPLQRRDELLALREATRQLWAAGTLLNQIARACNTQAKTSGRVDGSTVPAELLERCSAEIRSTSAAAHALMDSNRQAYRRAVVAGTDLNQEARRA
ncbi:MAG TPA: hypothetical protein VFR90_06850 [Methylibium sp.]|uniref:hypothetical protein n=1 Tax=Methylibium sp. TaxID=2067992 RepID=UPI002DB966C4|nr:hypothetical protein [Methylibium sp.]HEU4458824.1 hypothetical protein [Methylibium sp.]